MGEINIGSTDLGRLLTDRASAYGASYQQDFQRLAASHRGRPVTDILPLLRRAADRALLEFTHADLLEQAEAISEGTRYVLRITVT
ncbi:hypothetical protein AB0G73_23865 [Streptomyces sp. NPDC020719]|uniref:hypothetical protein n=1 Tax=Streptomyces sp. NPDC020719 TaxID=3154896 RepID=UPI00340600D4